MTRCEDDGARRKRAALDAGLVERRGTMERRIYFEVGYDHRDFGDCGDGSRGAQHGQHGMGLRFVLVGPAGAVGWLALLANLVPGNVHDGHVDAIGDVSFVPVRSGGSDAMTAGVSFHTPGPFYAGQDGPQPCEYLPGGVCYSDVTYTGADPLMAAFLDHGPHAVWAALARFYSEVTGEAAALDVEAEV